MWPVVEELINIEWPSLPIDCGETLKSYSSADQVMHEAKL